MNESLKNRVKSLLWRAAMMGLVAFIAGITENIATLELPTWIVVVLGLAGGEISKYLNVDRRQ